MELLKHMDLTQVANTANETFIQKILHDAGWSWFHAHEDDKVVDLFVKKVKVKDIRFLFTKIFGAE